MNYDFHRPRGGQVYPELREKLNQGFAIGRTCFKRDEWSDREYADFLKKELSRLVSNANSRAGKANSVK